MEKLIIGKKEIQVKDLLSENIEVFHKLAVIGVKSINTAIDYLMIYEMYQKYKFIDKCSQRKREVAIQCKVHVNTVENAISIMESIIKMS